MLQKEWEEMIKMNKKNTGFVGRIKLEKLHNTRDLGGLKTQDGKTILPNRLIRSGTLYEATGEDIRILSDHCGLGTVIDFRTATERKQKPDPDMPGVRNIFNPILDEKTVGITFEEEEQEAEEGEPDAIRSILLHASSLGGKPETYVDRLYEDLVLNDHAAGSYSRFFDLLLEADDRAVLWHCTAGKDRVGIGTALLLTALGVQRETIISDFVKTNDYVMEQVNQTCSLIEQETGDKGLADCVRVLFTVSEDYILHAFSAIEQSFGTIDHYLAKQLFVTPEKRNELRAKFLAQ
jgi:protein-tyrosine phosphatase